MNNIKALIVDDEPGSHKILENYITKTECLKLVGNSFNAMEAKLFLENNDVDLVFLDINMPEVDGFAFLNMLNKKPFVIFTTAYSEFAVESYEYDAIDYLKKPIPFERFSKAINKLMQWLDKGILMESAMVSINFKVDGKIKPILLDEIEYIQSLGNYVKIFTKNEVIVTQITTSEIENSLPKSAFLRIHKSFIVNKSRIEQLKEEELTIGTTKLPIGKTFKKYVKEVLSSGSI